MKAYKKKNIKKGMPTCALPFCLPIFHFSYSQSYVFKRQNRRLSSFAALGFMVY
ncbi:hypothetical protein CHCC20335_3182 [Bacillus paralicheniformis]|nr:hypothetical protein CHCC20335_3182 [Bacillus paralicheniformis]